MWKIKIRIDFSVKNAHFTYATKNKLESYHYFLSKHQLIKELFEGKIKPLH